MTRKKLTLSIETELIERAKEIKLNISQFLETHLLEYLALIDEILDGEGIKRTYGDSNPSIRLRRPEGYPDYLIGPYSSMEYRITYIIFYLRSGIGFSFDDGKFK
jgi:hypothetical protein